MIRKTLVWLALFLTVALAGGVFMAASSMQVANRLHQISDGLSVYIGLMPAEILKEHPAGHPETVMHGGIPAAGSEYHVVAAIFDANSGARISDATVAVTVFGPGNAVLFGQRHLRPWGARLLNATVPQLPLEPMGIEQTVSYGEFFVLPRPAAYTFQLSITRPGRPTPTVMNFVYDHRV
jgi:hypothetical protein